MTKMTKKFEGEGNTSEAYADQGQTSSVLKKVIVLSPEEEDVLKTVLDRDRTSAIVHGGLKSLLTLSDDAANVFLNFLRRI